MATYYSLEDKHEKVLDPEISTSILCSTKLMEANDKMQLEAVCRENRYYWVKGTNTVIMHVESDFCILIDNKVRIYNEDGLVSLPLMLSAAHYAAYQVHDKSNRDSIKNSANSQQIGYDIKHLIHGPGCEIAGTTLDHGDATFDEREKVKSFTTTNINQGSHRVKVEIKNQEGLDDFIKCLEENDQETHGLFFK